MKDTSSIIASGGLLSRDLLQRVANPAQERQRRKTERLVGLDAVDYGLAPGERVQDQIARSWNRLTGLWATFRQAEAALPETGTATSVTRERWLRPLLEELGFAGLPPARGLAIGEKDYPISHQWQDSVPIHLLGWKLHVDKTRRGIPGAARMSPRSLVQEFLNRSDQHLWGIVTNGRVLHLLRDNASLTRAAYCQIDIQAIFDGNLYGDFVTFWRLCHRSRFTALTPEQCILEQWNNEATTSGIRALEHLRQGVENAIVQLGQGFLTHPANHTLRERIRNGELPTDDYLRQLLRLVYRMLFLLVAEARGLLLDPDANATVQRRYKQYYSMARLAELAQQPRRTAHSDLWQSLKVTIGALDGNSRGIPELGLRPLGSHLWSTQATPDLNQARIDNRHLLNATYRLCYVRDPKANLRWPVDYRNLGTEELGSVYESLLELHPVVNGDAQTFTLASTAGSERKTTGSYYTPPTLINRLLDDALDPILDRAATEQALLGLRILDPACGSGHFLIAAAHRIAGRLATVRAGGHEPTPTQLRTAVREVIGRCVYGVDINPLAVELCKVALWLEANNSGDPLSFLDHHIVCGNSLLGTTPDLLVGGIRKEAFKKVVGDDPERLKQLRTANRKERKQQDQQILDLRWTHDDDITALADDMAVINAEPDNSVGDVAAKGNLYDDVQQSPTYRRAKLAADTWCAAFVIPKRFSTPAITDSSIRSIVQGNHLDPKTDGAVDALAVEYSFHHSHLAFPDIYARGGFDAVVGNPPWGRIKLKEKKWFDTRNPEIADAPTKAARQKLIDALQTDDPQLYAEYQTALHEAARLSAFLRNSGRYPLGSKGDIDTYPVFAEMMRAASSPRGGTGMIVPTGIATDKPTKDLFAELINTRSLVSLYDFENKKKVFPAVDSRKRFCLLTLTGPRHPVTEPTFVFFAQEVADIDIPDKRFTLTPQDFALLNPNTRTTPTFRRRRDAEITTAIYRRLPILVREGEPEGNPWDLKYQRMFDMANDSELFRPRLELEDDGWTLKGNHFVRDGQRYLPLYEGKVAGLHDHRAADVVISPTARQRQRQPRYLPTADKMDPNRLAIPLDWVAENEVASRVQNARGWLASFSDATSVTNQRTMVCSAIPISAAPHTRPLVYVTDPQHLFLAVLGSYAFDFVARQKIGSTHFTLVHLEQIPVPPPAIVAEAADWITPHMLELCYTAWDMAPFGADLGYNGPPFRWDNHRRALIQAEIDALMFRLYGIDRADTGYVLDTFERIQKDDTKQWGEYRTKRLILERYDAMDEADRNGHPYQAVLDPPPADPSVAHGWSTRPDWYPLTPSEVGG